MKSNWRALTPVVVGVVVVCLVGPASALGGPPGSATTDHALGNQPYYQQNGEAARQSIRIGVRENGSGRVTVRYRIPLTNANETAAFERLRRNVTTNASGYRARFGARMDRVVARAQATTERQMDLTNHSVDATRRGRTGVVTHSFVWEGFAATDGRGLRVDDTLSGFYVENGTRLTVAWPAGYAPTTVRPSPDVRRPGALEWSAPTAFEQDEPFVELVPNTASNARTRSGDTATATGDTRTPTGVANGSVPGAGKATTEAGGGSKPGANGASSGSDGGDGMGTNGGPGTGSLLTVAGIIVVLGAVVLGVWLGRRRNDEPRSRGEGSAAADAASDPEPSDPAATGPTGMAENGGASEDLLSNEEHVVRVLERAGGRAKQQHVVAELGWTEAKTSQVVGKLRKKGIIEGFRLGRENVLTISEQNESGNETE